MQMQARRKAWEVGSPEEQEAVRQKHWAAQRLLQRRRVRISFAGRLSLPPTLLAARRAFPQLLAFIEAVALLRQRRKPVCADGHIEATVRDYQLAHLLVVPILRPTFAPLTQRVAT